MGELQRIVAVVTILALACAPWTARAQLSTSYYAKSCPNLEAVVNQAFLNALASDQRIGASLLRLHFHDCFVQGCDGSILLADTPTLTGEQSATANNFLRGFGVVDSIKSAVEASCSGIVSCADILSLIARDAVVAYGGPDWAVEYGRRDSKTACYSCTNQIPAPTYDLSQLTAAFAAKGLSQVDLATLAGSHTVGEAHCSAFSQRFSPPDATLFPTYLAQLEVECASGNNLVDLDPGTPFVFDSNYYSNLLNGGGLLASDETLESSGGLTAALVSSWVGGAAGQSKFFSQYATSIVNLGNISPLTGSEGEIRAVCSKVNSS